MSWLNLLTPSAAVLAIFLAIALVVQSFRHGRAIRRLQQQIASAGLAAYDPTLDRLKALSGLSNEAAVGGRSRRIATRRNLIGAAVVVGVLILAGGGWALLRHDGSPSPSTTSSTKTTTHPAKATTPPTTSTATNTATTPAVTASCATATPITDPSSVTVSLYNGSGVNGAAGKVIGPKLSALGYAIGTVANAPNGLTSASTSTVEYVGKADLNAACSVATALGVSATQVAPLTLLTPAAASGSGVVVLIGRDIAS